MKYHSLRLCNNWRIQQKAALTPFCLRRGKKPIPNKLPLFLFGDSKTRQSRSCSAGLRMSLHISRWSRLSDNSESCAACVLFLFIQRNWFNIVASFVSSAADQTPTLPYLCFCTWFWCKQWCSRPDVSPCRIRSYLIHSCKLLLRENMTMFEFAGKWVAEKWDLIWFICACLVHPLSLHQEAAWWHPLF